METERAKVGDFLYYQPRPGGGGDPTAAVLEVRPGYVRVFTDTMVVAEGDAHEFGFAKDPRCLVHLMFRDNPTPILLYEPDAAKAPMSEQMRTYLETNHRYRAHQAWWQTVLRFLCEVLVIVLCFIASFLTRGATSDWDPLADFLTDGTSRRGWVSRLRAAGCTEYTLLEIPRRAAPSGRAAAPTEAD